MLPRNDLDLGKCLTQVVQAVGGHVLQIHVEKRMHAGRGDRESTAPVKPALEKLNQPDEIEALYGHLIAETEVIRSANGQEQSPIREAIVNGSDVGKHGGSL